MSSLNLGFVGLGRMGGPMTKRLLDAGHDVTVFDTSSAALDAAASHGAKIASSPSDVGDRADIVLVSLPTPDIVYKVVAGNDGVADGKQVRAVVDLSTTGPSMAARIGGELARRNLRWMDAPISGGIAGATNGTLAVMVSGDELTFTEIEAVLTVFGRLFYVGEKSGLAQVAKLANNLLAAAAMVVSSEAMVMGTKAGIRPDVLLDIINAGSGRNSATQDKFPRSVLPGTFDFGFATGLSYKDVRLCIDEAEAMGVPMVAGAVIRQMLAVTNARFGPDSDFTSICRVVEDWAGVEVRA
ncbi:NAD(P)-dependent oxidoreductase [Pelagibacterium limicola]|uniref:NAD(P)-dependent oxidoreductase n=1 Tax=Pelagibacterium limicola TaxID=2791022 RepID=UPI0018AFF28C|nr:NAD(P)-dependent oxidoreductase [Pelagibacterium limicola]